MILWTVQPIEVWHQLESRGVFRAEKQYVDPDFRFGYRWMIRQMKQRLSQSPDDQSCTPIWAWRQYEGPRRPRPDLRHACWLEKDWEGVRIEFEADEESALCSDFELWHYVLNYWYLAPSEADEEAFQAELTRAGQCYYAQKPLPNSELDARIQRSWLAIFDLSDEGHWLGQPLAQRSIQAVVWELSLAQVRRVDRFKAR